MKYYDPNTGTVTNTPPGTTTTQTSTGSPPTGNTSTGGLGSGTDLQQLLGLYALAKGNPTGAWSILKPPTQKLSSTERGQLNFSNASLSLLDTYKKKAGAFAGTGPLQGAMTKMFQNWAPSLADKRLMAMESQIGPLREQVINLISGANVSAKEADRVNSWIPSISKSAEKNRLDLISLESWLKARKDAIETGSYTEDPIE